MMMHTQADPERIYRRLVLLNWIFSIVTTLIAFIWGDVFFGISVFVGAMLVAVNIWIMEWVVKKAFLYQTPTKATARKVIVKYFIRFFITGLLIAILIMAKWVNPVGLLVGVLVIACSLFAVTGIEIVRHLMKKA